MNINNISVNKYPISQVFDPESKAIYEIPKYQREYTWGPKQWEALFDDLTENKEGYFLGSIICINTTTDSINSLKFEVVDGQQRITTISILLTAIYSYLQQSKDFLDDEQQSDLLQLKKRLVLKKTNDIRVIPQKQNFNLDDYLSLLSEQGIIDKHSVPKNAGNRRIYHAYNYFKKRIKDFTETKDNSIAGIFQIMDKVLASILVKIDVSNHSDAYTLFESLNDRGTPLTAVDLIKNLLLAKLDLNGTSSLDYYFGRWTEVLANLGDDYSLQERFFRQNYNAFRKSINEPFINDERTYPLGPIATRSTLLDIYQQIVSKDPEAFLNEISENAALYAQITLQNIDELSDQEKESYLNLQRVKGAPAYLLLMYLLKRQRELQLNKQDIIQINTLLVNFFIRRNIIDIPPTRDLTRLFMSFIEDIESKLYTGENIYKKLREKLISRSASDTAFKERLYGPIYDENSDAVRFILCMLAKQGMTKENQQDLWAKYDSKQYRWTIEHIFPQGNNIPECWVQMIAAGDIQKAKEYQNYYVHTLGNLTITGYNSTLSNKSFQEKRDRKDTNGAYIGYKNGLNLNKDVCDKSEWTIDIIKKRTTDLVDQIVQLFQI